LSSLPSAASGLRLLPEDLRLRPLLRLSLLTLPSAALGLRLRSLLLLSLPATAPALWCLLPHLGLGLGPRRLLTHLWWRPALRPTAATAASVTASASAVTVPAASAAMTFALRVRGAVRTC
jgi:hypothetical protein